MILGIPQPLVIILFFLLLLYLITHITGIKFKSLVQLFMIGTKPEFFTKPGWISLAGVLLVAAFCWACMVLHETVKIVCLTFKITFQQEWFSVGVAIVCTIIVFIVNLLFIGLMTYASSRKS